MKNLLPGFVLTAAVTLPMSVYAHPESHSHYSLMAFIHHFFTEPDHLAMIGLVLAILVYSHTSLRQWLSRNLSRQRIDKK